MTVHTSGSVSPSHPPGGISRSWLSVWGSILDSARWAASGDNGQPWRIHPQEDPFAATVKFSDEPESFLDYRGEASRIAMGSLLESISLAANRSGFHLQTPRVNEGDSLAAFSIDLNLDAATDDPCDPLGDWLESRHSNRCRQITEPLGSQVTEKLSASVALIPSVICELTCERSTIRTIAKAVAVADYVRFMHANCHEEFHAKIHWTKKGDPTPSVGFSPDTFEIGMMETLALRGTANHRVLRFADSLIGFGALAARAAKQQVLHSSCVGCLRGDTTQENFWLNVGRSLQRIWLNATAQGLGFQVLAVAPLLARRYREQTPSVFDEWQSKKLSITNRLLLDAFGTSEVAIMFRVGLAPEASARTGRMNWEDLVTEPRDEDSAGL